MRLICSFSSIDAITTTDAFTRYRKKTKLSDCVPSGYLFRLCISDGHRLLLVDCFGYELQFSFAKICHFYEYQNWCVLLPVPNQIYRLYVTLTAVIAYETNSSI